MVNHFLVKLSITYIFLLSSYYFHYQHFLPVVFGAVAYVHPGGLAFVAAFPYQLVEGQVRGGVGQFGEGEVL